MRRSTCCLLLTCLFFLSAGAWMATADSTHVMVSGDTLWQLSRRYYGDPTLYDVLGVFNGIDDYRDIPVGKKIIIPSDPSVLRDIKKNPGAARQIIADYKAGKKGSDTGDGQGSKPKTPQGRVEMDALSVLTRPGDLPSNQGTSR